MPFPRTRNHALLAAVGAGAALIPAAEAGAVGSVVVPPQGDSIGSVVELTQRAHTRAARRHVRLQRTNAQLKGKRPDADRRKDVRDWTTKHLRQANRRMAKENERLRAAAARQAAVTATATATSAPAGGAATGSTTPGNLASIAACESGGNPSAVDSTGTYRGKYQFDMQTWQSVGGSGDPAAASEAEQDERAAALVAQRGSSPWPNCG